MTDLRQAFLATIEDDPCYENIRVYADLLEEQGDAEADAWREIAEKGYRPWEGSKAAYRYSWWPSHLEPEDLDLSEGTEEGNVPDPIFKLVKGEHEQEYLGKYFHTRIAAYTALAAAITSVRAKAEV